MMLGYLILAHILGDFIFQPDCLVVWKLKRSLGIFIHVLIHFIITSIIFLPFILNGYAWILGIIFGICLVHFFIDSWKIRYEKRNPGKLATFIIDQLFHLITLALAFIFIKNISLTSQETIFYSLYKDQQIMKLLSLLILNYVIHELYFLWRKLPFSHLTRIVTVISLYALYFLLNFYGSGGF